MDKGYLHLYCGDGKGKTTAAMGLALRALGSGKKVVIVQFLKSGTSGELEGLKSLGAIVISGKSGTKFVSQMSERDKEETYSINNRHLLQALNENADLLILDEACAALSTGLIDEALLKTAVLRRPVEQELVLTGRNPAEWMIEAADYITEMKCIRHPYNSGLAARKGIEF